MRAVVVAVRDNWGLARVGGSGEIVFIHASELLVPERFAAGDVVEFSATALPIRGGRHPVARDVLVIEKSEALP